MGEYIHHLRLAAINAATWFATIISIGFVKDLLQIICLLASLSLSIASIWWIRRQAASLDKRDKKVS